MNVPPKMDRVPIFPAIAARNCHPSVACPRNSLSLSVSRRLRNFLEVISEGFKEQLVLVEMSRIFYPVKSHSTCIIITLYHTSVAPLTLYKYNAKAVTSFRAVFNHKLRLVRTRSLRCVLARSNANCWLVS